VPAVEDVRMPLVVLAQVAGAREEFPILAARVAAEPARARSRAVVVEVGGRGRGSE